MLSLRREIRVLTEWQDTVSSPLYKRVWFWLNGWNFFSLGRWYFKSKWKG